MFFLIPKPIRRLIFWGLVLAVLSLADVYTKLWAAEQVETRAEQAWDGAASIDASFSGFPFVGFLVVSGRVEGFTATLKEVRGQGFDFATIGIRLDDVELDRAKLLQDREVELRSIGAGTAFGEITQEAVSRAVGTTITFEPGKAVATLAGRRVEAGVTIRDGRLVITPANVAPLSVAVPTAEYLPCATDVTVLAGRVRVSCTLEEIPAPLVRAANEAAG